MSLVNECHKTVLVQAFKQQHPVGTAQLVSQHVTATRRSGILPPINIHSQHLSGRTAEIQMHRQKTLEMLLKVVPYYSAAAGQA